MTLPEKPSKFMTALPNALSLSRGILALWLWPLLTGGLARAQELALAVFIVGALTDYYDGYFARRYGTVSAFGKFADPVTDKLLILIPLVAFAKLGLYSIWWIVPIFVREILITFFRFGWILQGAVIPAERYGKWKFGCQVTLIIASFFVLLVQSRASNIEPFLMGLTHLILAGTVGITLLSGWDILRHQGKLVSTPEFAKYIAASGVGLIPLAPGTWGSAVGLLLAGLTFWNAWLYWSVFAAVLVSAYWAAKRMKLTDEDPGFFVLDEVAGMMLTVAFIPAAVLPYLLGFLFFRLFDIVKIFPGRRLEDLPGFWGIMLDDISAGIYAALALRLIMLWI